MQHHVLIGLLEALGMDKPLQAVVRQYLDLPDLSGAGCEMKAGHFDHHRMPLNLVVAPLMGHDREMLDYLYDCCYRNFSEKVKN